MAKDGAYFTGDRGFWDDGDFETSDQQLVYALLWQAHGTDIAGIRQRNDNLDAARVHLSPAKFKKTLGELQGKDKIKLYETRIWIKVAIWRNLCKGKCTDLQLGGVIGRLKDCGTSEIVADILSHYHATYGYKIPYTMPLPCHGNGIPTVTVTVPVSVTVSETVSVPESESFVNRWNAVAAEHGLAAIRSLSDSRKKKLMVRQKEPAFEFEKILEKVGESTWGHGNNKTGWKITFDFLIENDNNYLKILEGKYVGKPNDKEFNEIGGVKAEEGKYDHIGIR